MTFEEIVSKAKESFGTADVSSYEGHLALQINITGEGEGTFYAEINEGKLNIEPYTYHDNDATLTANADDVVSIFNGTLNIVDACDGGKLTIEGNLEKAYSIQPQIDINKKPAKKTRKTTTKTTTTKTAAKTTKAASKTTTKKSTKKAEESEETMPIIGLSEPTKSAPKATKKTTAKAAKESTKPAKKTTKTTGKKG